VIREEFGISQPAVSQQLRVLRESGFVSVRAEGTRRLYTVETGPLREVDAWLERFRRSGSSDSTRWGRRPRGDSASAS
jgi:DNA-binding transcriptional ArsR family regulator